jgi:hypothetical protein
VVTNLTLRRETIVKVLAFLRIAIALRFANYGYPFVVWCRI